MWPGSYPDDLQAKMRSFVVGSRLHRNLGGFKFEEVGEKWQVHDAGWAGFVAMLEYKARRYGRGFYRIGRFEPTSQPAACAT